MKTKKMFFTAMASMLMMVICLSASYAAQQKMKDGCMMKDGKMVHMMDGKMTPMETSMTMENGVVLMPNGEFTGKKGMKMMLREGEMMDMKGNVMSSGMKKMTYHKSHMKKRTRVVTEKTTN